MNFFEQYNYCIEELLNHQEKLLKLLKKNPHDKSIQSALKICENRIIIMQDSEEKNKNKINHFYQ